MRNVACDKAFIVARSIETTSNQVIFKAFFVPVGGALVLFLAFVHIVGGRRVRSGQVLIKVVAGGGVVDDEEWWVRVVGCLGRFVV